jgi:hypothetical protein
MKSEPAAVQERDERQHRERGYKRKRGFLGDIFDFD